MKVKGSFFFVNNERPDRFAKIGPGHIVSEIKKIGRVSVLVHFVLSCFILFRFVSFRFVSYRQVLLGTPSVFFTGRTSSGAPTATPLMGTTPVNTGNTPATFCDAI
jgi:hypothetical protein